MNNVKSVLINIGYHGELAKNKDSILLRDWQLLTSAISSDGGQFKSKSSIPKIVECLRFLTSCGIYFDGINLDEGLMCKARVFYLSFRVTYSLKNKEIWAFSSSLNYGCRILIKAKNTHQYADVIKNLPLPLQDIIAGGYGCEKKKYGRPVRAVVTGLESLWMFQFLILTVILRYGLIMSCLACVNNKRFQICNHMNFQDMIISLFYNSILFLQQ